MTDSTKAAREYDNLVLTRDDVLTILNAMLRRWNKERWKNLKYIVALEAVRAGVMCTPPGVIKKIWGDIVRAFLKIYELNEAQRAIGERPTMKFIRDNIVREIEGGAFDTQEKEADS